MGAMSRQTKTFQTYLNYAAKRNLDRNDIKDDLENRETVVNALKNLSVDPEWVHFHQRDRIVLQLPLGDDDETQPIVIVHGTTAVKITGINLGTTIDSTFIFLDGITKTEYPVVSSANNGSDTDLTLRFPYLSEDGANIAEVDAQASWRLVKKEYLLPEDFRELLEIEPVDSRFNRLKETSLAQLMRLATDGQVFARPERYGLISKDNDSRKYMTFFPYPLDHPIPAYEILYLRMPRQLVDGDEDYEALTTVVDWPDAMEGLLQLAIEVEVARKNADPNVLQTAMAAFDKMKGQHLRGSRHNSQGKRLTPTLAYAGERDPEVELDLSDNP
jgi:hypothetical protein